MTMFVPNVHVC